LRRSAVLVLILGIAVASGACGSGDDDGGTVEPSGTEENGTADGSGSAADAGFGIHMFLGRQQGPCPGEAAATEIEAEGVATEEGYCAFATRAGVGPDGVRSALAKEEGDGWTVEFALTDAAQQLLGDLSTANRGAAFTVIADGKSWGQSPTPNARQPITVVRLEEADARYLAGLFD
jgi:hypothetical protein